MKEKTRVQPWGCWTPPTLLVCLSVFVSFLLLLFFLHFFSFLGTVNNVRVSSSYFIEHRAPPPRGRSATGATEVPSCASHSVTGQLLPSSEMVNEHWHTVCTHQVVWVSGERFVLPGFWITCRIKRRDVSCCKNYLFLTQKYNKKYR